MAHFLVAGLGNPGPEYENTPHNAGRMLVEKLAISCQLPAFSLDKKTNALKTEGKIGQEKVTLLLPEGMMNNSGKSLAPLIKSKNQLARLLVVHDDLDLPLGTFKLSFNRGSAGHRGVESVMKKLKSQAFFRLRLGTCPVTAVGKMKKPKGEKAVIDYLLKPWKDGELFLFKKTIKKVKLFPRRGTRESAADSWVQKD